VVDQKRVFLNKASYEFLDVRGFRACACTFTRLEKRNMNIDLNGLVLFFLRRWLYSSHDDGEVREFFFFSSCTFQPIFDHVLELRTALV
jgi:hypothetical protein